MMKQSSRKLLRQSTLFAAITGILVGIITAIPHHKKQTVAEQKNIQLPVIASTPTPALNNSQAHAQVNAPAPAPQISWKTVVVRKGDTISKILAREKIPEKVALSILKMPESKKLLMIQPSQQIHFEYNRSGQIEQLQYSFNSESTLIIRKKPDQSFAASIKNKPTTVSFLYKTGVVHHSLASAAKVAGLTSHLEAELINIFRNNPNVSKYVRNGDRFSILYSEYYIDGKKDHAGDIVAAEFIDKNKSYHAIRFAYGDHHSNYYTPDGQCTQDEFLHSPISYKRIGSYFSYHRLDPVLHTVRPHLGVDFDAPAGTPVKSIGEGHITFAGYESGYGNTIIIQYGQKYKALYGHLAHFAKHIHKNDEVTKGQTIGYVGVTGWSTGPHLHFGMFVDNRPTDPLKMHFLEGPSIPKQYLPEFFAQERTLLTQLRSYESPQLAEADIPNKLPHEE